MRGGGYVCSILLTWAESCWVGGVSIRLRFVGQNICLALGGLSGRLNAPTAGNKPEVVKPMS